MDNENEEHLYIKNCSNITELHILLQDTFKNQGLSIYNKHNFNNFYNLLQLYSSEYNIYNNDSDSDIDT
jgi:hypothetical protein